MSIALLTVTVLSLCPVASKPSDDAVMICENTGISSAPALLQSTSLSCGISSALRVVAIKINMTSILGRSISYYGDVSVMWNHLFSNETDVVKIFYRAKSNISVHLQSVDGKPVSGLSVKIYVEGTDILIGEGVTGSDGNINFDTLFEDVYCIKVYYGDVVVTERHYNVLEEDSDLNIDVITVFSIGGVSMDILSIVFWMTVGASLSGIVFAILYYAKRKELAF